MSKKIISVGFDVPGHSDLFNRYSSNQSLLDADIIFFEPDLSSYESELSDRNGKTCYTKNSSFKLQEDSKRWQAEISTALEAGKSIFIFFRKYEESFIHTGDKRFFGSGKTTQIIDEVTLYSNYDFFPIALPTATSKEGKEIIFSGHHVFSGFWSEFKSFLKYESYLESKVDTPLFFTKTGKKIVGALFRIGKGNLILLPPLDEKKLNSKSFVRYNAKTSEYEWTEEAIQFGKRLIQSLVEIDKILQQENSTTPLPDWANEEQFSLAEEGKLKIEIEEKIRQISELNVQKNTLLLKLDQEITLKYLLFEKGKALENAIISALEILGYKAENFKDGNLEFDQVIISPEGQRYIGESEGKDNSAINIDKFRQLTSNIQEDLQREEVVQPAIGILFGNGCRLKKPYEREEQFTDKCLSAAKSSNCILVRTMDLFKVAKYVKEFNDQVFARSCRAALASSIGKIVDFPNIPGS